MPYRPRRARSRPCVDGIDQKRRLQASGQSGIDQRRTRSYTGAVRLGVEAAFVEGTFLPGDVDVEGGVVTAVGLAGGGQGDSVPGFVDLQVNGFGGIDFLDAASADYRV